VTPATTTQPPPHPVSPQPERACPPTVLDGQSAGDCRMVPTFTKQSIGQGGAQLYSGSIATATPQTFTPASSPPELNGFGVDIPGSQTQDITRCTPAHIHQVGAGFALTERQPLVHSRYTF
jgi:hypothetical protein